MSDEEKIATIIKGWTRAIEDRNREGILAKHADDLVMIDFPNTVHGIAAYAKTWDFFDQSRRGQVVFRPRNLKVTAGDHVAFAHCDIHCEGTTAGPIDLRLTTGLVKRNGDWIITHEHHSMPTEYETLIGPDARS